MYTHQYTKTSVGTIVSRNMIDQYKEFYVSFNDQDDGIYGDDTTALVLGQMQRFYILNGDHRAGYEKAALEGLSGCLNYFQANVDQANKFSEHDYTQEKLDLLKQYGS